MVVINPFPDGCLKTTVSEHFATARVGMPPIVVKSTVPNSDELRMSDDKRNGGGRDAANSRNL